MSAQEILGMVVIKEVNYVSLWQGDRLLFALLLSHREGDGHLDCLLHEGGRVVAHRLGNLQGNITVEVSAHW